MTSLSEAKEERIVLKSKDSERLGDRKNPGMQPEREIARKEADEALK